MLVFIPLLVAYTTLWSSILIFRVPIPTPSPVLLASASTPRPLFSLVSVVEEINTVINSLPAVSDLVYSVTGDARSAWYLDAPPVSPIPPSNLPACVPLDWPPLSDFGSFGTRTCDRVSTTDLVVWDGLPESPNSPNWFASMVNDCPPEDVWYFAALVTSGVGLWLACRLIAVAILRRSNSASTENPLADNESPKAAPDVGLSNASTEPAEIVPEPPVGDVKELVESTPNGRVARFSMSASFIYPVEQVSTHIPPSSLQCSSLYSPSPVLSPLILTPSFPSHSFNCVTHESPVSPSLPQSADIFRYHPIPLWSPKSSDIVSFHDMTVGIEGRKSGFLIPNAVFALPPAKRGSSLPLSTFYTTARTKNTDCLAAPDTNIAHRGSSIFSLDGARTPV